MSLLASPRCPFLSDLLIVSLDREHAADQSAFALSVLMRAVPGFAAKVSAQPHVARYLVLAQTVEIESGNIKAAIEVLTDKHPEFESEYFLAVSGVGESLWPTLLVVFVSRHRMTSQCLVLSPPFTSLSPCANYFSFCQMDLSVRPLQLCIPGPHRYRHSFGVSVLVGFLRSCGSRFRHRHFAFSGWAEESDFPICRNTHTCDRFTAA